MRRPQHITTTTHDEDFPSPRSMSIHAFIAQLKDDKHSKRPQLDDLPTISKCNFHGEAAMTCLSDLKPRPLSPLTMLSRSTYATNLDCKEVLRRVERLVHAKSWSYSVDLPKGCIQCQTSCQMLSFALNFWTNKERKLLIEIQRRRGCSILMHRVRKVLFQILRSDEEPTTECLHRCAPTLTVSPRLKRMFGQPDDQTTKYLCESLEICQHHLRSDRDDLPQLALESLVSMTDPQQSSPSTTKFVAQKLMGESEKDQQLHDAFMHTLRSSARRCMRQSSKGECTVGVPQDDDQNVDPTAILSLTVLLHCLRVMKTEDTFGSSASNCTWKALVVILRSYLFDTHRHPLESATAVQCVRILQEIGIGQKEQDAANCKQNL